MTVTAKLRHLKIAPRKVHLVADMIRGQRVDKAKSYLQFTVNRSTLPVLKLLNSAVQNAKNNMDWKEDNLFISSITVDEGPKLKRWMPRARGSASPIQKKTSHVTVILDEVKKSTKKISKSKKEKIQAKEVSSLSELKEEFSGDKKNKSKDQASKTIKSLKSDNQKSKIFRRKSI
jgi:large subunit ribosomal protein L22